MEFKYRADIDGLRGIAVLAVLFFHTNVPCFTGGFVGVDVFFVISGYLITSIILKEIKAENFSIARFYERRIRRIFPALFPVIAFVLVIGAYLFDANAFKDLGRSIAATTLFSSNILFWRESGYFDAPSLLKPLLHTWSLAVEEQFYIFFPLALMAIHRYLKEKYFLWVVIAFIISLVASIYGVTHRPSATFYLVPTRAWELMVGSILAFGTLPDLTKDWQRNTLTISGLALILFSIFFYTEATPFPGIAALAPVIGSGLIIYSGRLGTYQAQRLLTAPPLVFIGLISYSLYLWHWPLVAFTKYFLFKPLTGIDSAAIIVTSLLIASFSWKFIEQPFRGKRPLLRERKSLFAVAIVTTVSFFVTGSLVFSVRLLNNFHPLANSAISVLTKDPINKTRAWDEIIRDIDKGGKAPVIGAIDGEKIFALWGDSHARALIPALDYVSRKFNKGGYSLVYTAIPPLIGVDQHPSLTSDNYDISKYELNNHILSFIRMHPEIKTVFLAGAWASWSEDGMKWYDVQGKITGGDAAVYVKEGLMRTVCQLNLLGKNVVVVAMVPELSSEPSRYIFLRSRFPDYYNKNIRIGTDKSFYIKRNTMFKMFEEEVRGNQNVSIIYPGKILFDSNGQGLTEINGHSLYRDKSHLSTYGSMLLVPLFEEVFQEMAHNQSAARKISAN